MTRTRVAVAVAAGAGTLLAVGGLATGMVAGAPGPAPTVPLIAPAWAEAAVQVTPPPASPPIVVWPPPTEPPPPAVAAEATPTAPAAEPPLPLVEASTPWAASVPTVIAPGKPGLYLPEVPPGATTDLEQRLFDAVNAARVAAGVEPYVYDPGLARIARIRSRQMSDQQYFGHVDPSGYTMYTELLAFFGYQYAWAGENLALNNYAAAESPERAMASLRRSPSHEANILTTDFTRIGVGEVELPDGRHYYTMIFIG